MSNQKITNLVTLQWFTSVFSLSRYNSFLHKDPAINVFHGMCYVRLGYGVSAAKSGHNSYAVQLCSSSVGVKTGVRNLGNDYRQ